MKRRLRIATLVLLVAAAPALVIGFRLSGPHAVAPPASARRGGTGSVSRTPAGSRAGRTAVHGSERVHHVRGSSPADRVMSAIASTDAVSSYTWVASASQSGTGSDIAITSSGTASLAPLAVEEITDGSPFGYVAIRMNDTDVWYDLGVGSDTIPAADGGNWTGPVPLSTFMEEAGTDVGQELKAIMALGTGSPGGEIDLTEQAVAGATPVGTVTVDGQPAERYDVSIATTGFLDQPGLTSEERQTLETAVSQLDDLPLSATVDVSSAGFVAAISYSVSLPGGATVSSEKTFSDFNQPVQIAMPPVPPPTVGPTTTGPVPDPSITYEGAPRSASSR